VVVILAGYHDRMDTFFKSNPGFSSRIAHHVDFPDFTEAELLEIARLMARELNYRLPEESERALREYIERRVKQPRFANARSIRNALDRARLRQANRLYAAAVAGDTATSAEALQTLTEADIRASSVFQAQPGAEPDAPYSSPLFNERSLFRDARRGH
jgi:ATP-dependent Clp protease ATP-binding subunit ClpA